MSTTQNKTTAADIVAELKRQEQLQARYMHHLSKIDDRLWWSNLWLCVLAIPVLLTFALISVLMVTGFLGALVQAIAGAGG